MSANPRPLVSSLLNIDRAQFDRLQILFRTAYYIAKHEKPFTDFPGLLTLQELNNVTVGNMYRNDKQAAYFIDIIAEAIRLETVRAIEGSSFYSVLNDSSTDRSVVEEEIVYVRILEDYRPVTKFLSLQAMPRGTAEAITNAIDRGFQTELGMNENQWKEKLIGMASDGAAVMIGTRSGVMTRVRRDVPHLVSVHCTAHRLELCLKSSLKQSRGFADIEDFLLNIYKFYNNSPRNLTSLREAGQAHQIVTLKPTNVLGTRWVDHHKRALEAVDHNWLPMVTHLQDVTTPGSDHTEDTKNKARGFLAKLTDKNFLKSIFIQLDIYRILSRLSLLFQKNDTSIETVKYGLKVCRDNLILLRDEPGPSETMYYQSLQANSFRGVDLNVRRIRHNNHADPDDNKRVLINTCIDEVNSRFRSFRENPILAAANVFDPTNWPQDQNELRLYGRDDITTLVRHFRDILARRTEFNAGEVLGEWTGLKTVVIDTLAVNPTLKFLDIWQLILRQELAEYSNVLSLLKVVLLIPIHTSECERGFSLMGRIKTDWRAALNTQTMCQLMRIVLHRPTMEDFDPRNAIEMWYNRGQRMRRPDIQPYGQRHQDNV
ncbi:zinc finger protein 862-like [Glandiceps talaboti]